LKRSLFSLWIYMFVGGFAWTIQKRGGIDDETNGPGEEVCLT